MSDTELVKRGNKVALQQIGNTQRPVPVTMPDGTVYQADVKHNVWLLWADEEDLDFLLSKKVKRLFLQQWLNEVVVYYRVSGERLRS